VFPPGFVRRYPSELVWTTFPFEPPVAAAQWQTITGIDKEDVE
jgi:hypothetical protein